MLIMISILGFDAQPIRLEFQNTLFPKESLDDEWIRIRQKVFLTTTGV